MKHFRAISILLAAILIASCATIPSQFNAFNKNLTWTKRQQQLSSIHQWQVQGAMAVKSNRQAATINYNWQQIDNKNYLIHLFGPLGFNAVTIRGTSYQVVLTDSKKQSFPAKNPETLIQNMTGFPIPVSNLYYWIRGLPVPSMPSKKQFDSFNHLVSLSQDGYTIQFLQYTGIGNNDLPNQIIIQSKIFYAKIVVSRWGSKPSP